MKARAVLGMAAGALLTLSSIAHAFLGWPALRPALDAAEVAPEVVGALAVGWYFGSLSMLVFGIIVLWTAVQVARRGDAPTGPALAIAVAYLAFGLVTYLTRDFNPHFLLFVVTGALVGAFCLWGRGARSGAPSAL